MFNQVLKSELKSIVEKIKTAKISLIEYQRQNGGYDGGFYFTLYKLKYEYRHKHITYCLMKGRSYDVIERPAENNKPDMQYIKELMDIYESEKTTENVYSCAQ